MGKRSNFKRMKNDFYPTPIEAVVPLLPHLAADTWFYEPYSGKDDLIKHLEHFGHTCIGNSDLELDATITKYKWDLPNFDMFITNPPWTREILHAIILNLCNQAPTWLLFDADWMHTKQAREYLLYCRKIVSIGRVKWIPNSKYNSKDNCCWYLFTKDKNPKYPPNFYGRIIDEISTNNTIFNYDDCTNKC